MKTLSAILTHIQKQCDANIKTIQKSPNLTLRDLDIFKAKDEVYREIIEIIAYGGNKNE